MYTFYFLAWAMFSSLISVYLKDLGYKPSMISLLVSIAFLVSMLGQPLIGWLNDRFSSKRVTFILLAASLSGGVLMLLANNFMAMVVAYSLVILMLNGCLPVMERIATQSPFAYGKIRVWGTVGFAVGSQLAGVVYKKIAPNALFVSFILGMLVCLLGIWGTQPSDARPNHKEVEADSQPVPSRFLNKTFVLYLILALIFSGITNTGHTYIPDMLRDSGLSVEWSSTVVAIAVMFEAPLTLLSAYFMDKLTSKKILSLILAILTLQYAVYAFDLGTSSMVIATLLGKHTSTMLFIMVNMKVVASLVDSKYVITALSLVQAVRSLGSIIMQTVSGQILDRTSYSVLCTLLTALAFLLLLVLPWLKLPDGTDQKLFSK